MGSIIGHRIDYNGTYLAKINPSTPPPGKFSAHFKRFSKSRSFDSKYEINIESLYRGKLVRLRNMKLLWTWKGEQSPMLWGNYHWYRFRLPFQTLLQVQVLYIVFNRRSMVYILLQTLWLKASFCLFSSYLKRNARRQINFCSSFAIYNYNYRALSIYEKDPEISVVAKVEFPIGKKLFHLVVNPGTWRCLTVDLELVQTTRNVMEHDIPFGNSNRENGTTFLDFPLFLGIFQWDEPTKRVPFTAEPEIPEILTKWKAPIVLRWGRFVDVGDVATPPTPFGLNPPDGRW